MPWSFAVEALGLALELPFCQGCVFPSFRENPVMLCQVINSWQIAIYSYSEEFSNENLHGVLECLQLPVLDRPGIARFRLRFQGCFQKDFVMPISHCLVCTWSRGAAHLSFLWVLCPLHLGRLEEEEWYRQRDWNHAGRLTCQDEKGTSWTWWLGWSAGGGRMLRRYWTLKSGTRVYVCGRCLFVLPCR